MRIEPEGMEFSYERYFRSGRYEERYPTPNILTMRRLLQVLPKYGNVLDIGAGNGRYAIPLAVRGHRVIAIERSVEAREQLMLCAKEARVESRVSCYSDLRVVPEADVGRSWSALFLFGVLGHMTFSEREDSLTHLAELLPRSSVLAGSVPNRLRRFRSEQRAARIVDDGRAPRFAYSRSIEGGMQHFEYTAFTPSELREELLDHGWGPARIVVESIISESATTRHQLVGRIDRVLSRRLAARAGYGLFFVTTRLRGS